MKKRKYELQTLQETANDNPRLTVSNHAVYKETYGIEDPEIEEKFYLTMLDHSRKPGSFDYTQPQTYHAIFPDIEQEAYVEVGGNKHRKLQISEFSA